ncbi:MAG: caspase family protein [Spirochaetales bacterium]|nr:caspase family protein [Spirochaetales bacterium]
MKSSADRNFTDNDTSALKEVLEGNCGYETMVLNGSCDKSKVLKILQDIACSQSLKSLIFCYSGYGFNYRKQPFFIFGDYDPQHPVATALSYDELFYYFRMINDRTHVMAFIDYAFAGMDGRSSLNTDEDFVTIQREKGIKVIMSGSPKPIVYKDYEKPRSVFSFFLTEGLRGEADIDANGTVTFGEISEYLVTSCRNYLVRNKYEKLYMPEIFADSRDGDFNINARSKQIHKEETVRSERLSNGGLITFNERFNEVYNSEFGSSSERTKKDQTKELLTIIRTDFFDVKTFQPVGFFSQEDTGYVGLDIMLRLSRLPDPHKRIILSVYFYYPDGSLMCKLDKPCRPLNTSGMMNCRVLYGWDNPGHWQTGKYTVKIAYRDEVLSVTSFRVR